jgi:hypothetical protein
LVFWPVPPSDAERINLRFETDDGVRFFLSVDSDITIAKLKHEIFIEEKIAAKQLKALLFPKEPNHPDDNETLTLEELNDGAAVSSLPLKSQIIAINSKYVPPLSSEKRFQTERTPHQQQIEARSLQVKSQRGQRSS